MIKTFFLKMTVLFNLYLIVLFILLVLVVQFFMIYRILKRIKQLQDIIEELSLVKTTENPITEQTTENPTAEQTTENPITEQTTENPITEQTTENPTAEQTTETAQDEGNSEDIDVPEKNTDKKTLENVSTIIGGTIILSKKEKVIEAIKKRKEVEVADLPQAMDELKAYFSAHPHPDYLKDESSTDYYRFIDLRAIPSERVVVIGDIHSDYHSLVAILLKLSASSYDYFENACFVFLGDYLDRGTSLFEPLLLLKDLHEILGERLIMLKGNHESVYYDDYHGTIETNVIPNQSCGFLNKFCHDDPLFLKQFAEFYSTLPIYVYLKTADKSILLTHASIPMDINIAKFRFSTEHGGMVFDDNLSMNEKMTCRKSILKDMIWGDPTEYEERMQINGRFEFGSKQFARFASKNNIDLLLRSHEEVAKGYKSFFNNKLYTIFSTGGKENAQTGYPNVEPAFAVVLQDGSLFIENSFLYKMQREGQYVVANLFSEREYTEKQVSDFHFREEFTLETEGEKHIREMYNHIKRFFPSA